MTRTLACSTALALVFNASAALAVTPEEVWDSWQALVTSAGQELTVGGTARNGDTLEVTGLLLTHTDDLGGSASVSIDQVAFKDNGDGTVAVTMSDSYPMALAFPEGEDGPSSIKLTVSQPGLVITAGGSASETSYDFAAPTTTVTLDELIDEDGQKLDTQAEMTLGDLAAKYLVVRQGEQTQLDTSFTAATLALNVA